MTDWPGSTSGPPAGPSGSGWLPPSAGGPGQPPPGVPGPPAYVPGTTPGAVVGEVRGKEVRTEPSMLDQRPLSVWSFRIERFDAVGNRLQPVPVEMRGRNLRGILRDGDLVEVLAPWVEGQTLQVTTVRNISNGGSVVRVDDHGDGSIWPKVIVALVVIVTVAWLAYGVYRVFIDPAGPEPPELPTRP